MKQLCCLLAGLSLWACSHAQEIKAISQTDVERLMKTLASDQMQGRQVFTPGIEKAAAFIQEEFKNAGLEPLPGQKDFAQQFTVYDLQPVQAKAKVDGKMIGEDHLFALTGQEQISWQDQSSRHVQYIGPDEDFRQAVSAARNANQDVLVQVHLKHQEQFDRIKAYYAGQGSLHLDPDSQKTVVYLLMDGPPLKSYEINIRSKVQKRTLTNVAGMIPGKSRPEEIVVFSAHYDHIGILPPANGDSIANGADDDASGTAAVIALAQHFKRMPQPERTLIFVAFSAEEIGGYGSRYFSTQLNPDQIVAMFNIEMIGKPSKFGPNTAFITGFDRSDFGTIVQSGLHSTPYRFYPDPYPDQNLFYRSDNATLARLGVPAHTISSDQIDRDPYYHTVDDELETLNMAHLTNMIRAIALGAQDVVAGKATPTRIDRTAVE